MDYVDFKTEFDLTLALGLAELMAVTQVLITLEMRCCVGGGGYLEPRPPRMYNYLFIVD